MLYKGNVRCAVVALCLLALAGCNAKNAEVSKKGEPKGQVLAEVNGSVITTEDYKKEVEILPPYLKPMTATAEGRKEMIDSMIVRELVLQEAKKAGIDKSPEVADRLEDLKKRVIIEAYWKKKVEEQAKISDADLQKFYDENKEKFRTGDQVKASHILLKTEKEAQDVLAQLKAGGKFEDLARKYSVDPAGAKGGDLGWFGKGSMIPEFEKAAFALKEGETSGIVKSKFGYHIIKLTGKRAAGLLPLAEVKDQIKAALLPEKQQEIFKKMREDMKKTAKFSIKEDVLKSLDTKPASTGASAAPVEGKKK
jgi:peptidyl-prolyl cis-trans isomerase C